MNEKEARKRVEKYIKSFNGNALDCVAIGTVLTLLENKDKIIDLMAEWIEKHTKYYDEDGCYCEVEKDICNKNIECEYCIKQYFERKVENGN